MRFSGSMLLLSGLALNMLLQSAAAQNLCNSGCELVIDFIDGGSIEAVEPLIITFGEGGFIHDDSVTTGYARNEQLPLGAGENIQFTSGARLSLGDSGNIDYSAMHLIVNGDVTITALNDGSISMHGDSVFTVTGTLQVNSDLNVDAALNVAENNGVSGGNNVGLITPGATITVASTGSIITNTDAVEGINIIVQAPTITLEMTPVIPGNQIGLEDITTTAIDPSCATGGAQCLDSAGDQAAPPAEGQPLVAQNNSGSVDPFSLVLLLSLLILCRGRYYS